MAETLTDDERAYVRRCMSHPSVLKALRSIDAQAAERAALVTQLEAALGLRASLEALVRDRSDERFGPGGGAVYVPQLRALLSRHPAPATTHAALVAQVAELTTERDEARDIARKVPGLEFELKAKAHECEIADAEVTRLTEALAAAERRLEDWGRVALSHDPTREAARLIAEARVRELEARLERAAAIAKAERNLPILEALRGT